MKLFNYLLLFLVLLATSVYADSHDDKKCCPRKNVGGLQYTFSHESRAAKNDYGCTNDCIYTKDDGDGSETCFKPGPLEAKCIGPKCKKLPGLPQKYCQPGEKCWPTSEEVEAFRYLIDHNGTQPYSCLNLKKLVSKNDADAHNKTCLPYNGLLINSAKDLDLHPCKPLKQPGTNYLNPDPNCNANPFITEANYTTKDNQENSVKGRACMTPYQFLNNRNYKKEWMAAFIVTAETPEDVSNAIKFANHHNLGVGMMSTGHDLQDRNPGPAPNSLLIRTTCFGEFEPFLNEEDTITGYNGTEWTEGYAVVGAGLTFGHNFWWDLTNAEGLYQLAFNVGREIVGGSCHSVGIVGWMIGGGKGWTTPMYGLGVDNLLHADIVLANGTITSANYTYNEELFWAIRGGGGGFGVITSIKIKLHKPVCGTMDKCYSKWTASWNGTWTPHNPDQIDEIKLVLNAIFNWKASHILYWISFVNFYYKDGNFSIKIDAHHFGTEAMDPTNFNSFRNAFQNLTINDAEHKFNKPIITDKYYCEVFPEPYEKPNKCGLIPWTVQRWSQSIRMLVNSTTTTKKTIVNGKETNEFVDALIQNWQPLCDNYTYSACSSGFQFHYFFTYGNKTYDTGGAISPGFRNTATQAYNDDIRSNKKDLTFEEKESWMHYTLAPAMYKYSNASYFNEAEYTLEPGQWEERFWGKEIHCKLVEIKKKYDPEDRLTCRHCVGSEVGSEPVK